MNYPYTARDALVEPQRYMYTPFAGEAFIRDYFISRKTFLDSIRDVDNSYDRLESEVLRELARWFLTKTHIPSITAWQAYSEEPVEKHELVHRDFSTAPIETRALLEWIISHQLKHAEMVEAERWWRKLVQRFEVSKKLYAFYSLDLRQGSGDYRVVRNYTLLAAASALQYCGSGTLVGLNTYLKLMDTICSLPVVELLEGGAEKLLKILIKAEMDFIRILLCEKGLRYDY